MTASDPSAPPLIDPDVAMWAARLVMPRRRATAAEAAGLRARIAADMPAIDAAARRWDGPGADLPPTECRVVGRIGWVQANLVALDGAFDVLASRLRTNPAMASRVLGAQIGALLGLLSTKVLGQYVLPLARDGAAQLVVVGPNLLGLHERFGDRAEDLRRSVLLHEVAHRLQFEGVDWMSAHLRGILGRYLEHARVDSAALLEAAGRLPQAVAEARRRGTITPVVEAIMNADQRAAMAEAQGLMSLLEGHGNATMDFASEGIVEDPAGVREALRERRDDVTARVLSAVAGMEMKKRQYEEGEAFVRAVIDRSGVAGLNRAFSDPLLLPSAHEVGDPDAWLRRVDAA